MTAQASWLVRISEKLPAGPRVLFLPYAGAGVNVWRTWTRRLHGIEVWAALLPGREARFSEAPAADVDTSAAAIHEALHALRDRPLVLFGHSMGALLALELARRTRGEGAPALRAIIVSGHAAPDAGRLRDPLWDLPDWPLRGRLLEMGGAPKEVLADDELMTLLLPTLRADLRAAETWEYTSMPPLETPLTVLFGLDDPDTPRDSVEGWRAHTSASCSLRAFPGGHFFLFEWLPEVARVIEEAAWRRSEPMW